MVNNCRFLNIALGICALSGMSCPYMTDPHACPDYDEESMRPHHTHPDWADRFGKTESVTDFAKRVEGELHEMGIKTERLTEIRVEEEVKEAPDWF